MTASSAGALPRFPFPMQEGEEVLLLRRRHWWFLWPRTSVWTLFAVVPVAAAAWLLSELDVLDDLGVFFWAVAGAWLAYWAVRLLLNWYRYTNDIWVVTNQRVIDSYRSNPFNLRILTADLVNIQDMSVQKRGILATMLDFGDVVCETAGQSQEFRIGGVRDPEAVQLLVDRERDRERARHQAG